MRSGEPQDDPVAKCCAAEGGRRLSIPCQFALFSAVCVHGVIWFGWVVSERGGMGATLQERPLCSYTRTLFCICTRIHVY